MFRRSVQTRTATADTAVTALKHEASALSQSALGSLILVVLVIIVLLLTGRSQGG